MGDLKSEEDRENAKVRNHEVSTTLGDPRPSRRRRSSSSFASSFFRALVSASNPLSTLAGHASACRPEADNQNGSSGSCVLRRNSLPRESFPTSSISLSIRGTCGGVGRAFSEQRGRVPSPRRGCRTVSIGRSHTRKPLTIAGKRTSSWSVGLCWRATRSNEGEGRVFRRESRPFRFTSLPFVLKTRPGGCRPSSPKYASVG